MGKDSQESLRSVIDRGVDILTESRLPGSVKVDSEDLRRLIGAAKKTPEGRAPVVFEPRRVFAVEVIADSSLTVPEVEAEVLAEYPDAETAHLVSQAVCSPTTVRYLFDLYAKADVLEMKPRQAGQSPRP